MKNNTAETASRVRAPLPPKVIDPSDYHFAVAALARANSLLDSLRSAMAIPLEQAAEDQLLAQVDAFQRRVRGRFGS